MVVIRKEGTNLDEHIDFMVRREKVKAALEWLDALSQLPECGSVANRIPTAPDNRPDTDAPLEGQGPNEASGEDGPVYENEQIISGVMDTPDFRRTEAEEIRNIAGEASRRARRTYEQEILPAPTVDNTPLSELTPGYIPMAFPTLFPDGKGDFYTPRIRQLTLGEYFPHLLRFRGGRFSRHKRFPWFAFNTLQRSRALTKSKVFVRQNHDEGKLTGEDIEEMLKEKDESIVSKMMRYGEDLRGTRAYWAARRAELVDVMKVKGSPHIFFTLSAADLQWPDLHQHMPNSGDGGPSTRQKRREALNTNPHIAAAYLDARIEAYMEHFLKPLLGVEDFWYRYEWQARGSGHIHGFLWLKDAPNPDDIDWNTLKKPDAIIPEDQQEKMDQFLGYWDKIITATNPFPSTPNEESEDTPLQGVHPCNIPRAELKHTKQELADLLNWVERHRGCRAGYCKALRKVPGQAEPVEVCRFDYPHQPRDKPAVEPDSKRRMRFNPTRNDSLLNPHNRPAILAWRANVDFKPVLSTAAAIEYAAKYATKAEKQAPGFTELLHTIVEHGDETIAYPAQEVAHLMLSIPLVRSSFNFQSLSLSSDGSFRQVQTENENDPHYEEYCRTKFLLHHPFRDLATVKPPNRLWAEMLAICVAKRDDAQHPDHGRHSNHPRDTLNCWERDNRLREEDEVEDDDLVNPDIVDMTEEDWQVYARTRPGDENPVYGLGDLGQRPLDDGWDLEASRARWNDVNLMASYIHEERRNQRDNPNEGQEEEEQDDPEEEDEGPDERAAKLVPEQRAVYDAFVQAYTQILEGEEPNQQLLNIDGTAGCGKTFTIETICKKLSAMADERGLPQPYRVLAPSGVAALNIAGVTIHSGLYIQTNKFEPLQTTRLAALQVAWTGVHFLIIDEKSMVGQKLYAKIDSRCRQARPQKSDVPFGGFHVALFGDFAQLPPVGDTPLYAPGPSENINTENADLGRAGFSLYRLFVTSHQLTTVHRQAGDANARFRELLENASNGSLTLPDWQLLVQRCRANLPAPVVHEFDQEAVCLYATRKEVHQLNLSELQRLNEPCARIAAEHEGGTTAAKADADDAGGLEDFVVLSKRSKVMISRNLWLKQGLVNGTTGEVEDIIWAPGSSRSDLPTAVLVSCKDYHGPTLWRTEPRDGFDNVDSTDVSQTYTRVERLGAAGTMAPAMGTSLLRSIPPEVLVEICRRAASNPHPVSPLFLGKICRAWRRICYNAPTLWTHPQLALAEIWRTRENQLRLLEEWIARSGQLPLTLSIIHPTGILEVPSSYSAILNILLTVSSRVESLRWVVPYEDTSEGCQWPLLRELELHASDYDTAARLTTSRLFDKARQLTTLGLKGIPIKLLKGLPWSNLLNLTIESGTSDDVIRALRWAPNIHTMHTRNIKEPWSIPRHDLREDDHDIWNTADTYAVPPSHSMVTHNSLQRWSFSDEAGGEHIHYSYLNMRLLRLPSLKSFSLRWGCSEGVEEYWCVHPAKATAGWGCDELEELDVWLGLIEQASLVGWFARLTPLRSLKLHWEFHSEGLKNDLWKAMTVEPGKDAILPNLDTLVVEDTRMEMGCTDAIIDMLSSRWDCGATSPLKKCMITVRTYEEDHPYYDEDCDTDEWDYPKGVDAILEEWREEGFTVDLRPVVCTEIPVYMREGV
ncbi:hypothetical protein NMY22_g10434 [Coprinellus aureogranulatus]|nr:hypothetical protein NMY22_g10434 [Coprinellus aureogranulatus]